MDYYTYGYFLGIMIGMGMLLALVSYVLVKLGIFS